MTNELKRWMSWRAEEDKRLYDRYGRSLEKEHTGKFAAIGSDGQTIMGTDDGKVLKEALETFGSGNFGLFRVGYRTFGKWLNLTT